MGNTNYTILIFYIVRQWIKISLVFKLKLKKRVNTIVIWLLVLYNYPSELSLEKDRYREENTAPK